MEYLNKAHIGKDVLFERKYVFGRTTTYKTIRKEKGKLIARIKRHVENESVPEFADIIETLTGFVIVEPNDYEFVS